MTVQVRPNASKSVQIRRFFWSVFSRIWTEYGDLFRKSSYSAQIREIIDQKKLRIWTFFSQCYILDTKYVVPEEGERRKTIKQIPEINNMEYVKSNT